MAQTLCPFCGFTPLPEEAERCPKCRRAFVEESMEPTNATRTRAGALTGSVTAHPGPTAAVLALGAGLWVVRGTGALGPTDEPWWTFAVAALMVGAAAMLMANVGPAKHLAGAMGLLEVLAAGLAARDGGVAAACAGHGLVLVAMTAFEPGRLRLTLGAVAGVAAVAAALVQLGLGPRRAAAPGPALTEVPGWSLRLPPGWVSVKQLKQLRLPPDRAGVAFSRDLPPAEGVLISAPATGAALEASCKEALASLNAVGPQPKADVSAPPVFGAGAELREVKLVEGAAGRAACAVVAGRLVLLAVVSPEESPGAGAAAFEAVAGGLTAR